MAIPLVGATGGETHMRAWTGALLPPVTTGPLLILLAIGAALAVLPAPRAAAQATPVLDPIPEQPIQSGIGLELTEFSRLPQSNTVPVPPVDSRLVRWNRINHIGEVPDRSGRMYVPDLNGSMYMIEDGRPRLYLDVAAAFAPRFFSARGLGQGFGFVTFDPEFARNGRFYTVHTEDASRTTRRPDFVQDGNILFHGIVTEWTATDPSAPTFRGTNREVLRIGFAGQIHGIQQIDFNPEAKRQDADYGLLYVAVGDGGTGVRTTEPQDLAKVHGKVLRIDPRGTNGINGQYGIPDDNPFAGRPDARGEIYAVGFRDPHRFSWDPGAGHRMFLGHIGEHNFEAVNLITPGSNAGWSEREGPFVFDRMPANPCHRLYPLPADD